MFERWDLPGWQLWMSHGIQWNILWSRRCADLLSSTVWISYSYAFNLPSCPCASDTAPYVPCDSSCNNGYCDYTCGTCICHPFYTGEYCNKTLSEYWWWANHRPFMCTRHTHGSDISWFGMHIAVTPCGDYYCFNGGECVEEDGDSICKCEDPFYGEYCLHYPERKRFQSLACWITIQWPYLFFFLQQPVSVWMEAMAVTMRQTMVPAPVPITSLASTVNMRSVSTEHVLGLSVPLPNC